MTILCMYYCYTDGVVSTNCESAITHFKGSVNMYHHLFQRVCLELTLQLSHTVKNFLKTFLFISADSVLL